MSEQNSLQKIEKYNENKVVRVSQELYQLEKIRWRMSTLGYRLLFAISQSVSSIEEEILPDVGFEKQSLFKYLGLDNNNDKYNRLAETLVEVGQNMLQFATRKKNAPLKSRAGGGNMERYRVVRLEEQMYGCEELPEGA